MMDIKRENHSLSSFKSTILVSMFYFLLLSSTHNLFGTAKNRNELLFVGTIQDSGNVTGDFMVSYYVNDGIMFSQSDYVSLKANIDDKGNFQFRLPDLRKPYPIVFSLKRSNGITWTMESYAESGDNINISLNFIKTESIKFSGHGSTKYNLTLLFGEQMTTNFYSELNSIHMFNDSADLSIKLDRLSKIVRKFENRKACILSNNGGNLSPAMKEILKYECGRFYQYLPFILDRMYTDNPSFRSQIGSFYKKNIDNFFYPPGKWSVMTQKYILALLLKHKTDLKITKANPILIEDYYEYNKQQYKGPVRDALLAKFVLNRFTFIDLKSFSSQVLDSLKNDAAKIVQIPRLKTILNQTLKTSDGSKLVAANFIDLEGREFDISSLTGKVVLIDVWFTGCIGCAQFHEDFKKNIYPSMRDNSKFVILSLNIDKSKSQWTKGIESGHYTSDNNINVTTGDGLNHPFIKYYNITGGPYILLIKPNGDIYGQIETTTIANSKEFIDLLNKLSFFTASSDSFKFIH